MQAFVIQSNIARFQKLLETASLADQPVLQSLLLQERLKLSRLNRRATARLLIETHAIPLDRDE